jgi:peptidoglycan/xylan/chitin deacetylase (PgdA/CDA1 family)
MKPKKTGYPRARRSDRAVMTRRGLLGAAAVIGGAGLADALHKSDHPGTPTPAGSPRTITAGQTEPIPTPSIASTTASPTQSASKPPVPTHSATPTHHGGGHAPGNQPGAHGRTHPGRNQPAIEHVSLPAPKVRVRDRPVYSVDELIHDAPKHAIALTVDDGPDPEWTPKVLRLLDKYRMQASFCIIGMNADNYPKLVRDVARAGHIIVNHSYTHVMPFDHQSEKRVVEEITRAQRAIERAAKFTPQLFRAPGGAWSPFIFQAVAAYGLTPLDWDVDPRDWAMPGTRNIERAMLRGRPGDIVLCHDGGGNRSETVRALRKVLPAWKHRGYTTIPLVVPASAERAPTKPTKPTHPTQPTPPPQSPTTTATPTDSASTTASP